MFQRSLSLPEPGTATFFLWGPRQTGKSTLMRQSYPDSRWIDLLKADEFRRYASRPELLRLESAAAVEPRDRQIVIDEIQKVPALLDEVHWLIENRGFRFALCGSSARKVRRGAANLLGGRALRFELRGITARELGGDFDLDRLLTTGYLPSVYQSPRPARLLDAYVADYLRQEIAAEGLVRSLPAFSGFLDAAAFSDGDPGQFLKYRPRVRRVPPYRQGLLRDLGGHLAGEMAAGVPQAPQAPGFPGTEVLLLGCRCRQQAGGAGERWCRGLRHTEGHSRTGSSTSCPRTSATGRWTPTSLTGACQAGSRSTSWLATCCWPLKPRQASALPIGT